MTIDLKTVKHISKLSRISIDDNKAKKLSDDLNSIFKFIEKLEELDTEKIEPLTSIVETNLKFDVKNSKGKIIDPSSVCSGGEYLVTKFKGDPFLGTGVSIGIDRLVFCLLQKKEIEAKELKPVLICVMEEFYLEK